MIRVPMPSSEEEPLASLLVYDSVHDALFSAVGGIAVSFGQYR